MLRPCDEPGNITFGQCEFFCCNQKECKCWSTIVGSFFGSTTNKRQLINSLIRHVWVRPLLSQMHSFFNIKWWQRCYCYLGILIGRWLLITVEAFKHFRRVEFELFVLDRNWRSAGNLEVVVGVFNFVAILFEQLVDDVGNGGHAYESDHDYEVLRVGLEWVHTHLNFLMISWLTFVLIFCQEVLIESDLVIVR